MEEDVGRPDDKAQVNADATEQVCFTRHFMWEVTAGTYEHVNGIRGISLRDFAERVVSLCPDHQGIEGLIDNATDNVVLTYPAADRAHLVSYLQGNAMIVSKLLRALGATD